ncbi:MAG: NAD(P)H-dependent oxidoreductase subunit E [Deltaproteobacteria bacterium]|nr:MAG: NAD(P)H-dependent oxidoreductase subunit E [Deltaproteobacteria bacterium]
MLGKLAAVDKIIEAHGSEREGLIQILLDIQREFRWLPKDILEHVSKRLDVPINYIYNLTTFYAHFSLVPKGRHSMHVCMGTACHVRGAERLLERTSKVLGIKPGQTSRDEKFSLDTVNCLGACALGPVMIADDEYLSNPTMEDIRRKADSCE